jgi:hypothetical protein
MGDYEQALVAHYEASWGPARQRLRVGEGPLWEMPPDYAVLQFPPGLQTGAHPGRRGRGWTYATCGMSQPGEHPQVEIFIDSDLESLRIVEILNMTAHFHRTGERLGWGHTVNFGTPWLPGSLCDHGLLSAPYLDPERFRRADVQGHDVELLWLIPITREERDFKIKNGLELLEQAFERAGLDFGNPLRPGVV